MAALAAMVLVGALGVPAADAAPTPTGPPAARLSVGESGYEPTGTGQSRETHVEAAAVARKSGDRVEVLSQRSSTSRAWALPEGGFVAEQYAGDVRFPDPTAPQGWRDIDPTLVRNADGTVAPRALPDPVVLTGAGRGKDLVTRADRSGAKVGFDLMPGAVWPEPVLSGASATYPEVLAGVDVRVDVTRDSVSAVWLVKSPQGLKSLLGSQSGRTVRLSGRVTADHATFRKSGERLELVGEHGKVAGRFRQGFAWDAAPDTEQAVPVAFDLAQRGSARLGADSTLVVEVDRAWLADPARVYPITIDPDYTSGQIRDVYVRDGIAGSTNDTELRIGYNGSYRYRSFINFNRDEFFHRQVTYANFQIWNKNSYAGCTRHAWELWESDLFQDWHGGNNQPVRRDGMGWSDESRNTGSSACDQGWATVGITWAVQNHWATGERESGIQLRAANEGITGPYKRFRSSSAVWGDGVTPWNTPPRIVWGYNSAPAPASGYHVEGFATSQATLIEGTLPVFVATLPQAPCYRFGNSCLRMRYDVYGTRPDGSWEFLFATYSDFAAGGTTVSAATPETMRSALTAERQYSIHGAAYSVDAFSSKDLWELNEWNSAGWQGNVIQLSFEKELRPTSVTADGLPSGSSFELPATVGADGRPYVEWKPILAAVTNVPLARFCSATVPGQLTEQMHCVPTSEPFSTGQVPLDDDGFGGYAADVYVVACTAAQCSEQAVFRLKPQP